MPYETAARASEVLALTIDDPGLDARRAPIRSKGGDNRMDLLGLRHRAPAAPRLIRGRQPGRCSAPGAAPAPARRPAAQDLCPATGRARLGCDRARILFTPAHLPARFGNCTSCATPRATISASKASRCS